MLSPRAKLPRVRLVPCIASVLLIACGCITPSATAADPAKTMGPNACAECHKQEVEAWKGSHHFKTFREMPRNARAKQIAERMGVRRIKSESLCLTCHYTVQQKDGKAEPVAGISCESCHSAGRDWIKIHSSFSGKKAETESKAEAKSRWKEAESKGMIRPRSLYRIAKNCFGCHVVPEESLVNKGGHRSGSNFDLVAWSQGEVRHNTWHSKGKENTVASAARKRMLYLVGLGVELETALRALAKAKVRKVYAFEMAQRVARAREKLAVAGKAAPEAPELGKLATLGHAAALKLDNERALTAAADDVAKLVASISQTYDGSTLAKLDSLVAKPNAFKGKARPPSGS